MCSICNSWRSHAGTGCESRGARGWDAWRVAAALPPCCLLASLSFPFPSPPLLNTCFCLALAEPVTRLGLPICLSLAPAGHGSKEATLQARVYLHNVLYYTIRGGGRAVTGRRRRRRRRRRRNSALRVYFEMQANTKQSAGLADAVANQAVHVGWTRERKAKTTMISRCERGRERMGE